MTRQESLELAQAHRNRNRAEKPRTKYTNREVFLTKGRALPDRWDMVFKYLDSDSPWAPGHQNENIRIG